MFAGLDRKQKEAVGLLSIGTFLEYFDLMLYVHMAVLLNVLFFPETDPFTASLISAFAFCSTYLFRPFGALIFGYIGDRIGRKPVVILTTMMMAVSCAVIGCLPTYAQIGLTASWIITICRAFQGMAATAEARGAEIYISESVKPPLQYPLVALITAFSGLGTTLALGIAAIFTNVHVFNNEFSWRIAFLVGAGVAVIGTVARTSLKEADEFAHKKAQLQQQLKNNKVTWKKWHNDIISQEKSPILISVAYFLTQCARPPCFYFIYIYCADLLKHKCGMLPHEIISQNFIVSLVDLFGLGVLCYLSYRINPLKILKAKLFLFFSIIIFFPVVLNNYTNPTSIFVFQCLAALFVFDHIPATPIFYRYFPIFKRFTYTSVLSAVAKLLTYFITSFGLVYANEYFGYSGMFLIFIPVGIAFYYSVQYFQKLESKRKEHFHSGS